MDATPAPPAVSTPPPRQRPGRRWGLVLVPMLLAGGIAAALWPRPDVPRDNRRAARTQPVSVQAVRRQPIQVVVRTIGTLTASNTAIVHAQVSGVLQALRFHEGAPVRAGEVIAQIDPRAFEASLGAAEGTLARDRAQLDNARLDLARYRDLQARDAIAQQQVDTQAALVHQLEGTVQADQAAVDTARLQLSYTRVTAPITGRAGLKQVDLGNVVSPTDATGIVIVTQTKPIALVFAVPSAYVTQIASKLHDGQPLPVEAWDQAGTQRLAVGRLATLDNAIDPTTATLKLKALFDNADDRLFPNQAVSVRLQLDTLADALAVPSAAVQRGAQGFFVYTVDAQQQVHARPVQPGPIDGDWTAVTGPVHPGEQVVIDGLDKLRDGAKIEVIQPGTGSSQRPGGSAFKRDGTHPHHPRPKDAPPAP